MDIQLFRIDGGLCARFNCPALQGQVEMAAFALPTITKKGTTRSVDSAIWRLPQSVRGSEHRFKYRLALVVDGVCVLRFDNEAGKGDHKHVANAEEPYKFNGPEARA